MAFDEFGKIAAAEIAFYAPVFCIAFFVALRHGFSRRAGWVFLFTFSLVRIAGAAVTIVYKSSSNPSIGLIIAATILSGIGLAPLLFATLGFVTAIAAHGVPLHPQILRGCRILLVVGVALATAGGSMLSPDNKPSSISTGHTLTRVGVILFLVAFVCLFALHVRLWQEREAISTHHRTLLSGVSLALPPLLVRIIYAILSAFASSSQSRFSSINGDWRIYLVLGLIMEYIVVCVYVITGAFTPLHKDEEGSVGGLVRSRPSEDGLLEMGKSVYASRWSRR